MNLYTFIISTTDPKPDDEVYVSVNAPDELAADVDAQNEVRALGLSVCGSSLNSVHYNTPQGEPVVTRKEHA